MFVCLKLINSFRCSSFIFKINFEFFIITVNCISGDDMYVYMQIKYGICSKAFIKSRFQADNEA